MTGLLVLALLAVSDGGSPAPAPPESPADYRHLSRGPVLDVGIGTQMVGDDLAADLGVQTFRLTSHQRRWLLGWDALVGARMGWLANQHPYTFFAGFGARGTGELGYRLHPEQTWSLFVGAGASALLQLMWHPGVALSRVDTLNASDGFGGLTANGGLRLLGGASFLTAARAFHVEVVVQEWLRGAGVITPFSAFTQLGVAARLDFAGSLSARGEALYGWAPARKLTGLDASDAAHRYDLSAQARLTLHNRMWLGAVVSFSQESDAVTYATSKTHYASSQAPTFAFTLAYGFPLGGEP